MLLSRGWRVCFRVKCPGGLACRPADFSRGSVTARPGWDRGAPALACGGADGAACGEGTGAGMPPRGGGVYLGGGERASEVWGVILERSAAT